MTAKQRRATLPVALVETSSSHSLSSWPPRSFKSLLHRDAYEVLGVNKGASASDLKKAYYKLARDFHPDTSKDPNAKEKFIEIQEAYDILSDDSKRANYDQFGHSAFGGGESGPTGAGGFGGGAGFDPFNGGGGFGGFGGGGGGSPFGGNAQDIFEQLFTGRFTGADRGGFGGARGGFDTVGRSIKTVINIPFMEAAKGTTKTIAFEAVSKCKPCSGSGLKPGEKPKRCTTCGGTGQLRFVRGGFQMAAPCNACGGAGSSIPPEAKCKTCDGMGRVNERQTVEIKIPPGVYDGLELRIARKGNVPLEGDGPEGDLFVQLKVGHHPIFKRDGADVLVHVHVPIEKALLGGVMRIPTIDGDVELSIPPGTQPMEKKRLRARGVIKLNKGGERGDQWVTLMVDLPKKLTPVQRKLIEQAFGTGSAEKGKKDAEDTPKAKTTASSSSSSSSASAAAKSKPTSKAEPTSKSPEEKEATEKNDKKGFFRSTIEKLKKELHHDGPAAKE
ncbi:hypothetical protein DFJ77DRAFT_482216 [Powellomyces hirtus]|nr:hypothetical protein DFJ77DRAFT_482216 [Powellomyces hirtus]